MLRKTKEVKKGKETILHRLESSANQMQCRNRDWIPQQVREVVAEDSVTSGEYVKMASPPGPAVAHLSDLMDQQQSTTTG